MSSDESAIIAIDIELVAKVRGEGPPDEGERRDGREELATEGPPEDIAAPPPPEVPEAGGPPEDIAAPPPPEVPEAGGPPEDIAPPEPAEAPRPEEPAELPREDVWETVRQAEDDAIDEAVQDVLRDDDIDTDELKRLMEGLRDVDEHGMRNVSAMARNPTGFMENGIMLAISKAGPYGALIATITGMVVASPEIFKAVVQQLGVKGGPLNQDWRLTQEEQDGLWMDRHTQYQRLTGDDPVIRFNDFGYIAVTDPDFRGNSLVYAERARTTRIDLSQSALEYIHGI